MNIPGEMIERYRRLSVVNLDFLDFVEKNPASLSHSNFKLLELKDNLFKLQPWPTFINQQTKETFREASEKLFELIKGIPGRVFHFNLQKMSEYYGVPVKEIKNQLDGVTPDHINNLLGRGDFILSAEGLKCLEFNVVASLGGWQIPIWESLYSNHPIIAKFLKDRGVKTRNENLLRIFMEHLVQSTIGKIPGCDTEMNVAFVYEGILDKNRGKAGNYLDNMLKEILDRTGKGMKGNALLCDYPHLFLKDTCLFCGEKRIHALVEMYLGYVSPGVMEAFKAGNIRLQNGPISFLLSNKLNLALLSDTDTSRVFTAEERKTIDKYVPWTRKIIPGGTTYRNEKIPDLEHFILSNKERLVIKPSQGLGGTGIYVGIKSDDEEWNKAVTAALTHKNWLVQELVESVPGFYQSGELGYELHDMVWGFFMLGPRYAGVWNRVMPQKGSKGVINCHAGATVSMVFAVDESEHAPAVPAAPGTSQDTQMTAGKDEKLMEINKDTIKSQEALSRINSCFLEYVRKNPEALSRSSFESLELNNPLFKLQPWPTFISRQTQQSFQEAGVNVFNLIKHIPDRVFKNDPYKISEYFNIPVNAVKIQLNGVNEEHIDYLLARGDFILSPTGLKCIEYNVSANLGGVMVPVWEKLYYKTAIIAKFLEINKIKIKNRNLIRLILEHSISLPLEKMSPGDEEINIAIVSPESTKDVTDNSSERYLNEMYKDILQPIRVEGNRSIKGNVFMCGFPDLKLMDGYVFFNDRKIRVLIELSHGFLPPKILESFTSGKVYIINGPISDLLSDKLTLAVLSSYENSGIFTDQEAEIIAKYIPWTRKIIPGNTMYRKEKIDDLVHFILSNREKMVIKPSRGRGGEGICVGIKTSQEEWEIVINKAVKAKNWLVQEYVESSPGLYQFGEEGYELQDMVWGFFITGNRYAGAWNRVMPRSNDRGIINCHQGATVSILFEVDD